MMTAVDWSSTDSEKTEDEELKKATTSNRFMNLRKVFTED